LIHKGVTIRARFLYLPFSFIFGLKRDLLFSVLFLIMNPTITADIGNADDAGNQSALLPKNQEPPNHAPSSGTLNRRGKRCFSLTGLKKGVASG